MPAAWLQRQVDSIFHKSADPKPSPKEALSHTTVEIILQGLLRETASTDKIASTLAMRDVTIILLGFYHLLRVSEIAAVRLQHFEISGQTSRLLIPSSKTDQSGRGVYIPLITTVPHIGSVQQWAT